MEPSTTRSPSSRDAQLVARRALLRGVVAAAALGPVAAIATDAAAQGAHTRRGRRPRCPAEEPTDPLRDSAVGMYTDASVAQQASSFTMNRATVSCGVGTLAAGGSSGPFAMLMYATRMDLYAAVRDQGVLRATGRMRSITEMGGRIVENVEHDFLAIAREPEGSGLGRFDVHFRTPFWTPGKNPMATRSEEDGDLSRFGGGLLMGYVSAR